MKNPTKIPTHEDLTLPLLKAVGDGKEHRMADLRDKISDDLGLSEEQKTRIMPKKNTTYVYDRTYWARTLLRQAGLVSIPGRGMIKITSSGAKVLNAPPPRIDRKYLRKIPEFVENTRRDDSGDEEQGGGDETPEDAMRRGFKGVRNALYAELEDAVQQISPEGFERLVLELFRKMRYGEVKHTGRSGDGGIDGIIRKDRLGLGEIYVQAKQWNSPVQVRNVREFMGVLDGKEGIFITTSTFTPSAAKEAKSNVALIDGKELVRLMEEYGVGVSEVENITIKALSGEYFEQFK